jgi:hypothetical protein
MNGRQAQMMMKFASTLLVGSVSSRIVLRKGRLKGGNKNEEKEKGALHPEIRPSNAVGLVVRLEKREERHQADDTGDHSPDVYEDPSAVHDFQNISNHAER